MGLALLLAACASGDEAAQPTVTVTEAVTASPEAEPPPESTPGESGAPEPWVPFATADETVTLLAPVSWSVVEQSAPGAGTRVSVATPEGYLALDVHVYPETTPPYASPCDDPASVTTPYEILARRSFDPLIGSVATTTASPLEIVTFTTGDDISVLSLAQSNHVDAGCVGQQIPIAGGSMRVTTPYGTDAPLVVYALFDTPQDFLDSTEHDAIVDVLMSVRISGVPTA